MHETTNLREYVFATLERAIFESLVGKSRSARLRGNHLDPADSLFSSGASSVPAPGNALSTKPQSSRIRDQDLISSMSSRLRTLERQLNLANEACVEKVIVCKNLLLTAQLNRIQF